MSVLTELEKRAFTKATQEEKPAKQPVVTYGEAKSASTVRIDGYDIPTPCSVATEIRNGDRVRVVISDHGVLVTDNLTRPSTSDEYAINAFGKLVRQVEEIRADTGRFGNLFADSADVYVLVSENATVAQLAAADAEIARLEANDLTAQKIETTDATIACLKADEATLDSAVIGDASITTINANCITVSDAMVNILKANIADLEQMRAGLAKIATLDVDELLAAEAIITAMQADTAYIKALTGKTITTSELDAVNATVAALNAGTLSAAAAELAAATIKALLAQSGWFQAITVTGDASITGTLRGVLLDGDTARFQNIYADALKLLGSDGLYHALNFQGLDDSKETVYSEVTPESNDNPSENGWYVLSGSDYVLTEDTAVVSGTTYYEASYRPASSATRDAVGWDRYGEALDGGLHGSHIIAESITADKVDATSLRTALLNASNISVGNTDGFHINIDSSELGFYSGVDSIFSEVTPETGDNPTQLGWYEKVSSDPDAYRYTTDTQVASGKTYYEKQHNEDNRVAYIDGYRLMIPYSVVLNQMILGEWAWTYRKNGNMDLVYIGSEE